MTYQFNDRGIITSPGKFEGEPIFVAHYWDSVDDADCIEPLRDEYGPMCYRFVLTADELEDYPGLGHDAVELVLWEDDQGFVHHEIVRGFR